MDRPLSWPQIIWKVAPFGVGAWVIWSIWADQIRCALFRGAIIAWAILCIVCMVGAAMGPYPPRPPDDTR